mmetsp:Transcript_27933/g.65131  ORF Transcript_27933/g.65131 Transcript_27933/m.65131 type:complete len:286 (+) Transcript_27933:411-1268(+)
MLRLELLVLNLYASVLAKEGVDLFARVGVPNLRGCDKTAIEENGHLGGGQELVAGVVHDPHLHVDLLLLLGCREIHEPRLEVQHSDRDLVWLVVRVNADLPLHCEGDIASAGVRHGRLFGLGRGLLLRLHVHHIACLRRNFHGGLLHHHVRLHHGLLPHQGVRHRLLRHQGLLSHHGLLRHHPLLAPGRRHGHRSPARVVETDKLPCRSWCHPALGGRCRGEAHVAALPILACSVLHERKVCEGQRRCCVAVARRDAQVVAGGPTGVAHHVDDAQRELLFGVQHI